MSTARRSPGEIRDAIAAFLRQHHEGSVAEIHRALETTLAGQVAASSVRSYLRLNAGRKFQRIGRGRYRLLGS